MLIQHSAPKIQLQSKEQRNSIRGTVIIVDVLRAFTTAAYALAQGARKIILVQSPEEANILSKSIPGALTIGREETIQFDFDNSPWALNNRELDGKILIQYSSLNLEAIRCCLQADRILAASFVIAEATLAAIASSHSKQVTFFFSEGLEVPEDKALVDYLQLCLTEEFEGTPALYLREIVNSPAGQQARNYPPDYPLSDLDAALAVNAFPFAIEIVQDSEERIVLQAIKPDGLPWK